MGRSRRTKKKRNSGSVPPLWNLIFVSFDSFYCDRNCFFSISFIFFAEDLSTKPFSYNWMAYQSTFRTKKKFFLNFFIHKLWLPQPPRVTLKKFREILKIINQTINQTQILKNNAKSRKHETQANKKLSEKRLNE